MKKFLKGKKKKYFSLAIITIYSTLHKLSKLESSFTYHKRAFDTRKRQTSPPEFKKI
jgi:hypothetical protein